MKCEVCGKPGERVKFKVRGHAGTFHYDLCEKHDLKIVDGEQLAKAEIEEKIKEMRKANEKTEAAGTR